MDFILNEVHEENEDFQPVSSDDSDEEFTEEEEEYFSFVADEEDDMFIDDDLCKDMFNFLIRREIRLKW